MIAKLLSVLGRPGRLMKARRSRARTRTVSPRAAHQEFAQVLQFLRNPATPGLTTILAAQAASASSPAVHDAEETLATIIPEVQFDGVTLEVEPMQGAARDYRERRAK